MSFLNGHFSTLTNEDMQRMYLEGEYRRYGGKEAYEQHIAAERAAREAMPKVPELKEVLAIFWSERGGETWDHLTEIERDVRVAEMDRRIGGATNPHYH